MPSRSNDIWVQTYQNPFGARVAAIIDPIAAAKKAGTLKYQDVLAAQEQLEMEISDLTKAQQTYEQLGETQRKTIAGSRETLDPIIAEWRKDLAADLARLGPPPEEAQIEGPGEEVPTMGTILAPLGQTPQGQAKKAATQQKKRALGGRGRSSTILGGAATYGQGRRPVKTILGY